MSSQIALVHLHLDFEQHLVELLRGWNMAQNAIEFVGVRPSRSLEHPLLTPGAISDDEASRIAARIRTEAGYSGDDGVIVFTEKRLFDDVFYQLFVGGRQAHEMPPRVAILSLQFMRAAYEKAESRDSKFFSAIVSNILFSIGTDIGLADHGDETRGCIMDFCGFLPAIEVGLAKGPAFCGECASILRTLPTVGPAVLGLPEALGRINDIAAVELDVTKAIVLRGQRHLVDTEGYDYDVALSFCGSDRKYAEQLAAQLRLNGIRVFYDRSEQADLWGRNLQIHLAELYRIRARYCVVLISASYVTSRWTKVELEAALAREFECGDTYILPLRLDDTVLRELSPTRCFVDARGEAVEDIAALVKSKLTAVR